LAANTTDEEAAMPARLELISHHLCPYVQRAVIALTEKGVAHERRYIDLADKPDWFTVISPLGKVPLLRVEAEDGGGAVLFESAVICEYLEDTQPNPLHPSDPLIRAQHRAWIEFASAALNDVAGFYNAKDEAAFGQQRQRLTEKFAWLERHLDEVPFFAGRAFSLVDAAFGPVFRYIDAFERIGAFGFLAATPRVRAYRLALAGRPSVQQAVAEDYPARLLAFLERRGSHLSSLIPADAA
jgi:glutathione S-transferase